MVELRPADVQALGALLNERAGLKLAADGEFGLALALRGRMQALGHQSSAQYLAYVRGPDQDAELHRLLPLVTVGKTDFFRDARQFQALEKRLVPAALANARRARRPLRLWSAACATGEEPYSVAIVCLEAGALPAEVDLRATDINAEAISEAERAVYGLRKLRPVSNERLQRFFISEGQEAARLAPDVRRLVRFGVANLAEEVSAPPGGYDLILCRNVLIYFDAATMVRTLGRLYDALAPGGHLALGYSESLYRIYNQFELTEVEGAFFYRRPDGQRPATPAPLSRPLTPTLVPRVTLPTASQQARITQKIVTQKIVVPPELLARPATPSAQPVTQPQVARPVTLPPQAPHRLARSVELMEQGKFLEALEVLRLLCGAEPDSLIGWMSMGNLLAVLRRFPEAFDAFDRALAIEPLSAEARLFSGVARVEAGQHADARRELARALFLDQDLALAEYYLGRACEGLGDVAAARRAYKNCLALCQGPKPARPYMAHYPDLPKDPEVLGRAAQYALGALG